MKEQNNFSFRSLENQYRKALNCGYSFLTCHDYVKQKQHINRKVVVNRVDIDFSVAKAEKLLNIFDKLNVKATFFVRMHAGEYNPFSFENYRIIKAIRDSGHEIGYHSEVIDQASIWNEDPEACLIRDIEVLNRIFDINIRGVASHGGLTGLNNLDFWKFRAAKDLGLLYEAYDNSDIFGLFYSSFYISDSEWVRWKCYDHGKLCSGDSRSFAEHILDEHPLIYLLIHPDTYFEKHIYE